MPQDPQLSAEQVAELEHQLADAAAQVARVQAQLTQAQAAGVAAAPPPSAVSPDVPGSTIPPVPYAGTGPHVITINGQQVEPGTGNLAGFLQAMGGAAGGAAPVVV